VIRIVLTKYPPEIQLQRLLAIARSYELPISDVTTALRPGCQIEETVRAVQKFIVDSGRTPPIDF